MSPTKAELLLEQVEELQKRETIENDNKQSQPDFQHHMSYVSGKLVQIYQDMSIHNISVQDLNSKNTIAMQPKNVNTNLSTGRKSLSPGPRAPTVKTGTDAKFKEEVDDADLGKTKKRLFHPEKSQIQEILDLPREKRFDEYN